MTTELRDGFLCHVALDACGVRHGFGLRGSAEPVGTLRPRQVHGTVVARLASEGALQPAEADAVVCTSARRPIAVVTADCVPILMALEGGAAVAAIHAGWRGLAAGVVGAGARALLADASGDQRACAVVGPHIRACCYEVDAPVVDALGRRFGAATDRALTPTRPGHHHLDLSVLVALELESVGLSPGRIHVMQDTCTHCDGDRFESFRRDGDAAGRMVHFVQCSA